MGLSLDFSCVQRCSNMRISFSEDRKHTYLLSQYHAKLRNYKRPDFNRMILDLSRKGWTHEKIASVLPVSSASTVSEWSRGGKPNYENGEAFVMLWQCLMQIERVPRLGEMQSYQYTHTQTY